MSHGASCGSGKALKAIPKESDFFALFGLPFKLTLPLERLTSTFHDLSRKFHPDFYQQRSKEEQQVSLENSALLNRAYQTLRDPIKRIEYLMGMVAGGGSGISSAPPADLFEAVFTLQEALETFQKEAVAESDKECLRQTLMTQHEALKRCDEEVMESLQMESARWDQLEEQREQDQPFTEDQKRCAQALQQALARRAYLQRVLGDLSKTLGEERGVDGQNCRH